MICTLSVAESRKRKMPHVTRIWGPPGTGKTTYLLNSVQKELVLGRRPDRIGYYAFTRAAANEAINRALTMFPTYTRDDLAHFRTIHSECFKLLGLTRETVLNSKALAEFAKAYNYRFSSPRDDYQQREELIITTQDDMLLFFEEWRRAKCISDLSQAYGAFYSVHPYDCPVLAAFIKFHQRYTSFKIDKRLYDFTDMLASVVHRGLTPEIDVMFVDEAQDLNPLEFMIVELWSRGCQSVYICGDPLQAIYVFQGAEPKLFFSMQADEDKTIVQSHRVPKVSHKLSMLLAQRTVVGKRLEYLPTSETGFVAWKGNVSHVKLHDELSYFILARNRTFLEPVEKMLLNSNVPFRNLRGLDPFKSNLSKAIKGGLLLAEHKKTPIEYAVSLFCEYTPSKPWLKHGAKTKLTQLAKDFPGATLGYEQLSSYTLYSIWDKIYDGSWWGVLKVQEEDRQYFKRLIASRGVEILDKKPNVTLGTIHSVKGAECDITICLSDMTRRTYQSYCADPEREIPVWYVAVTRNKKGLYIIEHEASGYFDW